MKDETVLERLEAMCKCEYDILIAAHRHKLKEDLKKDIEAAQKEIEAEPSTSINTENKKLLCPKCRSVFIWESVNGTTVYKCNTCNFHWDK